MGWTVVVVADVIRLGVHEVSRRVEVRKRFPSDADGRLFRLVASEEGYATLLSYSSLSVAVVKRCI